jgi:hypothetical protein
MMRERVLGPASLCLTGLAIGLGGCGGSDSAASKPVAARPSAEVRRQLTDSHSPAATVARFWGSIQRGALPLSLSLYEPNVVSAVGIGTFAGMLNQVRATAQAARLNVVRVETVSGGQLVTAQTIPKVGAVIGHSFYLRRVRGRRAWRIAYDTVSAAAIQFYVQDQIQRSVNPAAAPGRKALSGGDKAAEAYRLAALVPPRAARRPATQTTTTSTTPAPTTTAAP